MPDVDLEERLRRMYAAVDASEERDLSKLPARVIETERSVGVYQDFSGGLKDEEIANLAYSLIHNIANLEDHLRKWAVRNGKDKSLVDQAFKTSFALQVIKDLSNNDKHGYPRRDKSHSGRSPKLVNPRRILRVTTAEKKGSGVTVTLATDGTPKVLGSGSAKAIVTGEVVDDGDVNIGDLYDLATKAVDDWVRALERLGALS